MLLLVHWRHDDDPIVTNELRSTCDNPIGVGDTQKNGVENWNFNVWWSDSAGDI